MTDGFPLYFASIPALLAALAVVAATVLVAWRRRARLPGSAMLLAIGGLILLSLAAGGISSRRSPANVVVMVDRSPSTRGASFHDERRLADRLDQVLGDRERRIVSFSDAAARETVFTPPGGADAILLFSDGRFTLPDAPVPVFAVLDPQLESPDDAAVDDLRSRDGQAIVEIVNPARPGQLHLTGTQQTNRIDVGVGAFVVARPIAPGASRVTAAIAGNDLWPENDALATTIDAGEKSQRWWIGRSGSISGDWRRFGPDQLPTDPADFLAPAIIVVENLSAADFSDVQQDRLVQYVRDLGGSILLVGGNRAFVPGASGVDRIEELSPLSGDPPQPTTHWLLLADSSGSMAGPYDGRTRWAFASDAMIRALHALPPHDTVTIGSFAKELAWWSTDRSAAQTGQMPLPPAPVHPTGETNLQAALQQIAAAAQSGPPAHLLLLTDAQASLDDPAGLARALKEKRIHLHVLATGPLDLAAPLRRIVEQTGGSIVAEDDPKQWAAATQTLLRQTRPSRWMTESIVATFRSGLGGTLPPRELSGWNRTWAKPDVTLLAEGIHDGQPVPLAATWRVGAGQVAALAFPADKSLIDPIRRQIEASPRDPRFTVMWTTGPDIRVRVDARQSDGRPINDLSPSIESPGMGPAPLAQTAPGRYEASIPAPRAPVIAQVSNGGTIVARKALAGRYDREFEAIGNDHAALLELALRTGGRVVAADDRSEIQFPFATRERSLVRPFALAGAFMLALSLILWRLG